MANCKLCGKKTTGIAVYWLVAGSLVPGLACQDCKDACGAVLVAAPRAKATETVMSASAAQVVSALKKSLFIEHTRLLRAEGLYADKGAYALAETAKSRSEGVSIALALVNKLAQVPVASRGRIKRRAKR